MMSNPYLIPRPAIISFSGGRTSGYMLKHIIDAHGGSLPDDVKVVFANTGKEMPETLDFVQECSSRWGVHIVWLEFDPAAQHKTAIVSHNSASRNGEPFEALIRSRGYLPNPVTRFCTVDMKIKRISTYARRFLGWNRWANVVGLRSDEPRRVQKLKGKTASGRDIPCTPLADAGVTKKDISEWWSSREFDLALYGVNGATPLGNCDLCFLKGSAITFGIMRDHPSLAEWWRKMESMPLRSRPEGARFRNDRPSYSEMMSFAGDQGDLISLLDGESLDCNCTD